MKSMNKEYEELNTFTNELLYGDLKYKNVISVDYIPNGGYILATFADGDERFTKKYKFRPYMYVTNPDYLPNKRGIKCTELQGDGNKYLISCANEKIHKNIRNYFFKTLPDYFYSLTNYSNMFMIQSGMTSFKGMKFEDLRRMQFDIETDSLSIDSAIILAIGVKQKDFEATWMISDGYTEEDMLRRFIAVIQYLDPDIIESYNGFKFDLPIILNRCAEYGIELNIGRDCSRIQHYNTNVRIGGSHQNEITKFRCVGRNIVDVWVLAKKYDEIYRKFNSFSLKEVAKVLKVAPEDRTYVDASKMTELMQNDPETARAYLLDDVRELDSVSKILSMVEFYQAQMLPFKYDDIVLKGTAARINSLFLRDYYKGGHAIPQRQPKTEYEGALSGTEETGIKHDVWFLDISSLYPTIMLHYNIGPKSDTRNVFINTLRELTTMRLKYKALAQEDETNVEYEAIASTMKVLINSYYGMLGAGVYNFNDMEAASEVTKHGRNILMIMKKTLSDAGFNIMNYDTDGLICYPVSAESNINIAEKELIKQLPIGFNFDTKHYKHYMSYKAKNYALIDDEDNLVIKGASFKSRQMVYFAKEFLENAIVYLLTDQRNKLGDMFAELWDNIINLKLDTKMVEQAQEMKRTTKQYLKDKDIKENFKTDKVYEMCIDQELDFFTGNKVHYYHHESGGLYPIEKYDHDYNVNKMLDYLTKTISRITPLLTEAEVNDYFMPRHNPYELQGKNSYKYNFVYSEGENHRSKWTKKQVDKIPKLVWENNKKERITYVSPQFYATGDDVLYRDNIQYIYFDLDSDDNIDKGIEELKKIYLHFNKDWGIRSEDIHMYFSGSRGFHLMIHPSVVGMTPRSDHKFIMKAIADTVRKKYKLKTIDNVYKIRGMMRACGSLNLKSGLYKIPITFVDILKGCEYILELAKTPIYQHIEPSQVNKMASVIYKKHIDDWVKAKKMTIGQKIQKMDIDEPPCVTDLRTNFIRRKGDRNTGEIMLATFYKMIGTSLDDAKTLVEDWVTNIPDKYRSNPKNKSGSPQTVQCVYESDQYGFGCNYMRSMGTFKNPIDCKKSCPLYNHKLTY